MSDPVLKARSRLAVAARAKTSISVKIAAHDRPRCPPHTRPLALAYVRVSTEDQAEHGASLYAQRAALAAEADRRGWELVLLSPNIDTAHPAGRFTAHVLASAAQYEGELISQRTREGMAQRKAEGVRFGRPNEIPDEVHERILRMRAEGVRVSHIARTLTEEGVPTARGEGVWRSSTIDRVLAQAEQMVTAA